ncbi:MAG: FHA domain-containing protein [Polaromonas sp.]|uniref:FHA domain-containing protein n=1 Tax=Polaromonas sp. TaxID=1869339 RepID=UPI0017D126CB|nr:FHA domain-containing protein [Polaromonas sp.]MBA3594227.1 FHA domain-containing protein [Polaromonas sp.]
MPQLIASVEGVEIKHVHLRKDRTTLGRRPYNDIVLNNPLVSGEHCVFELHGLADVYVEDLGSTNGTYLNGHMIKSREQLQDNDAIAIGNFKVQYLAASGESGYHQTAEMKLDVHNPAEDLSAQASLHASFKVLSGSSAGLEVPVVKAVSTFGNPEVSVVAVSHRRYGYYVAHLTGPIAPLLNGTVVSGEAAPLRHNDVLELAGTSMQFLLRDGESG